MPRPADARMRMLDFDALATKASRRYGFTDAARLTAFGLTENPTFRIDEPSERGPVVLRIYRPAGRPEHEIRSELAWISAVSWDIGVPTPAIVPTLDGSDLAIIGDGGQIFAAAFEVAPGREAGEEDLGWLMGRIGELTALLHRHARSWQPPQWFERPRWDLETTLGDRPHWGPWQVGVFDTEERRQLERLATVTTRRLARFGVEPSRFGLIHADLRAANILVDGNDVSVIDFDDCGFSWYLYDLAATLTFYETLPTVDDLIAAWVDAYRRVEPLPAEHEAEIKTFLMLRRLLLSAYIGIRPDTELAAELHRTGFSTGTCMLAESYLSAFS